MTSGSLWETWLCSCRKHVSCALAYGNPYGALYSGFGLVSRLFTHPHQGHTGFEKTSQSVWPPRGSFSTCSLKIPIEDLPKILLYSHISLGVFGPPPHFEKLPRKPSVALSKSQHAVKPSAPCERRAVAML